jgi:hypothetical protein
MKRLIVAFGLVGSIIFVALMLTGKASYGYGATEQKSMGLQYVVMTICTFVGICSKSLFLRLHSGANLLDSLAGRDLVLSAMAAPVALMAVYNAADQIKDTFLLALFSYQNGFFVNNITTLLENKSPNAAAPPGGTLK